MLEEGTSFAKGRGEFAVLVGGGHSTGVAELPPPTWPDSYTACIFLVAFASQPIVAILLVSRLIQAVFFWNQVQALFLFRA